jgi:hypothetical protein
LVSETNLVLHRNGKGYAKFLAAGIQWMKKLIYCNIPPNSFGIHQLNPGNNEMINDPNEPIVSSENNTGSK